MGFYLGDIPLSPPAMGQIGKVVIDPNLYDLDRVEVLRGPQGDAVRRELDGRHHQADSQCAAAQHHHRFHGWDAVTHRGGRANGGADFMVNYSTSDYWALRAVGSYDYRSGWISRTVVSPFPADVLAPDGPPYTRGNVAGTPASQIIPDVNDAHTYSGRVEMLIQPSDALHINLLALSQRSTQGGYDEFDNPPGPGYMTHFQPYPIGEYIDDRVNLFSATVEADLGFAKLTNAAGYFNRHMEQSQDASEATSWTLESFLVSPQEMAAIGMPTYIKRPSTRRSPSISGPRSCA